MASTETVGMTVFPRRRPNLKYRNQPTIYDGDRYASKREAEYAAELDLRKKAGDIRDWWPQHSYDLTVNGHHVCKYIADFVILHNDGTMEAIDVKGAKKGAAWQMFQVKRKLYEALRAEREWPPLRIVE